MSRVYRSRRRDRRAAGAELTTDAIIRLGRRLEDLDLFFFEEPVDPFDVEALKKVSENGRISVPDRPGLGVTLVAERVRPFLWAECA